MNHEQNVTKILYLHGFGGGENGIRYLDHGRIRLDSLYANINFVLEQERTDIALHAPDYHQPSLANFTVSAGLKYLEAYINDTFDSPVPILAYSFGGYLAALLSSHCQERIEKLYLFAPSLDNYERNMKTNQIHSVGFMKDLQKYPARPKLMQSAIIVHGCSDNDFLGGNISRMDEYVKQEKQFITNYFREEEDGHSLSDFVDSEEFRNMIKNI
eukprot:245962_1